MWVLVGAISVFIGSFYLLFNYCKGVLNKKYEKRKWLNNIFHTAFIEDYIHSNENNGTEFIFESGRLTNITYKT